jgi:spermidine synthase
MTTANDAHHVKPYVQVTLTTKALHFSISELQSRMDLRRPDALDLEYTRLMMGLVLFKPAPANLAMIGLGGGSLAKFCHRHLPKTRITVVEINPHVVALRDEFQIPPDGPRFGVELGDGADFVHGATGRFDVLLVDGFDYDGLPDALCSQRFYDGCCESLAPEGLLVVNLHAGHKQFAQQIERIRRSFAGATLAVDDSDGSNCIVFAGRGQALAGLRVGPLRRPRGLDAEAWGALQPELARIVSALKAETV